jgi:hypothetical protein
METTAAPTEGMISMPASDLLWEAMKGAGMVVGYLQHILTETLYYAGKTVAQVRSACSGFTGSRYGERSREGNLTMVRLVRNEAVIAEADRREFYLNLGRDLVEATKSSLESENLTIIDLSRYEI